jgi:UDP-N-acetylglucosamine 2-epimerase
MKIITILGTRPEIVKLSALMPLLDQEFDHKVIHTGQHYDYEMDAVFFEELKLGIPDFSLNIGSHSQGKQTGLMLHKIEEVLLEEKPDLVIVQGDTNTTLSGALAASKLHIPLMHVEAGCRSFNRKMPEEINRILTDNIADFLIAPDQKSMQNLRSEGIPEEKIHLVGSTSFDAVLRNKEFAKPTDRKDFVLVTIHRAESTQRETLKKITDALNQLSEDITVVFAAHPRTTKAIEEHAIILDPRIKLLGPQPYLSFLSLMKDCRFCISDSGGIQEEVLAFNKPCIVPRKDTEWMSLVEAGKNFLVGNETQHIVSKARMLLNQEELDRIKGIELPYTSGASQKILEVIRNATSNR